MTSFDLISCMHLSMFSFISRYVASQQQGITNYFDVKSVQEYSAKVEKLGDKVICQKGLCQVWVILLYVQIQRIMGLVFLK